MPPATVLSAVAMGIMAGALLGLGMYAGLSRIPTQRVFYVTNLLMALLAGSLASQLARALAQAGFIETWAGPMWDSSPWLPLDSALGALLHALIGYDAQPSAAQLAAYLGALAFIFVGTRLLRPAARKA